MPDVLPPPGSSADRLDRLWARGAAFLGTRTAIMGGAMSWVSERRLVSARATSTGSLADGAAASGASRVSTSDRASSRAVSLSGAAMVPSPMSSMRRANA